MSNLSLIGKAMLDFSWMSTSQIAALFIAIAFSVISVATSILAFKYAAKLNTFIKAVAMTMIAPFLAVTAWLYLVFSFLDAFRTNEVLNIVMSILIALFLCGVVIVVSKALYAKNGQKLEQQEETDNAIDGICEDQTNALPAAKTALLIEEQKQESKEVEETPVETAEEKTEEVEKFEETPVVTAEEKTEEVKEEAPVETAEEKTEKVEEFEETPVVTLADDAEEIEEVEEAQEAEEVKEEAPVENTEEVYDVDGSEDEESEEDDEDEEFKKFIESLRARNRVRSEGTDGEDK